MHIANMTQNGGHFISNLYTSLERNDKKCLPRIGGLWALGGEGNSVEDPLARGGNTTWAPRVAHVVTQMPSWLSCHTCHHRCHRIAVCRSRRCLWRKIWRRLKNRPPYHVCNIYKQQGWEGKMHEIYWNILKYDVMLRESSAKIMDIEVLKRFDYNTKLGFDGELWLCLYVFFFTFQAFLANWCLDTKCKTWQLHFRYLRILLGRFEILSTLSMRFQGEPSMSSPLRICAALCAEAGWECEHSNQSKPKWTIEWSELKYYDVTIVW